MASVTAILVNYHGADDILAAVAAVLDDEPAVRVVVVDNSESEEESARLRFSLPVHVQLLVAPRNLGFGAACNWAASEATADFYWLVNPDLRVQPGCLAHLLGALRSDPRLGAVSPRQFLDVNRRWKFSPSWLPTGIDVWVRERALREPKVLACYGRAVRAETLRLWGAGTSPVYQRALSGAAVLIRHACLSPIYGMFDPDYFMYFEDSDLCVRLRRSGWRMAVVPQAEAVHLWRMGGHKNQLMADAAPRYFDRHFSKSRWLSEGRALARLPQAPLVPQHVWEPGAAFGVPRAWRSGWSLEISYQALFLPSVGLLGSGEWVPWPAELVDAVEGVPLVARMGPMAEGVGQPIIVQLGVEQERSER